MKPYYEDGAVTIYHGDSLDVLRQIPDGSVDVLLTDPPYSSGGMFRSDRQADPASKYRGWSQNARMGSSRKPTADYGSFGGDNRDQRAFLTWVSLWTFQAMRATREGGHGFLFTDWRQLPLTTDAVQLGGWTWRGIVVWDKGVARPVKGRFRNHVEYVVWATHGSIGTGQTDAYPSAVIAVPTVGHRDRVHVTEKPVALLAHLLSVVPGKRLTILDPFTGSGSTLVAAKAAGHRAIGIEVDERYCEIAARRCAEAPLPLAA